MLNSVVMSGRLVNDPELRKTTSGTSVTGFRLACDETYKGPNGERNTVFINVTIFGKGADTVVQYMHKGNLVGVIGRLTQRKYTNKEGNEVTTTEIVANSVEFLESKAASEASAASSGFVSDTQPSKPEAIEQEDNDAIDIIDDDLPF